MPDASTVTHVVIHDSPSPQAGGIEVMAYSLAMTLKQQGYKVAVTGLGTLLDEHFPADCGIEQIRLQQPVRSKSWTLPRLIRLLWRLRQRYGDQMVCHCLLVQNVKTLRRCQRLFPSRVYGYIHGNEIVRAMRKQPQTLRKDIEFCDVVVANSQFTRNLLAPLGKLDNIRLLHPAINLPATLPNRRDARAALGIGDEVPLLVMVGRLTWRKAHRSVIDAVAQLGRDYPQIRLLIGGSGGQQASLQLHINSLGLQTQVQLLGRISEAHKWQLLSAADFALMPSLMAADRYEVEGFGIANIEAAAAGAIPVGTATGGIPEALDHGRAGILLEACDETALSGEIVSKLKPLLAAPEQLDVMRQYAMNRAQQQFRWDNYVTHLMQPT